MVVEGDSTGMIVVADEVGLEVRSIMLGGIVTG